MISDDIRYYYYELQSVKKAVPKVERSNDNGDDSDETDNKRSNLYSMGPSPDNYYSGSNYNDNSNLNGRGLTGAEPLVSINAATSDLR